MPVYSSGLKFSMPKSELIIFSPHTSSVIIFPSCSQCCHYSVFWAWNIKIASRLPFPSQPPFSRQSSNPFFFLSPLKCHLNHSFLHSHYISSSLTLYFGLHNSFVTIQLPQYPVYPPCTRDILIINTFELLIPLLKNSFWFPTAFNIKSKFFMRPHLVCPTSSYHKP